MPQIGRTFLKLKDPQAQLALEHLYDAFQRLKVDKDSIDASSIASAVGKAMKDGELEPLERFLGGKRFAGVIWLNGDDKDTYRLYLNKPEMTGAFPALGVFITEVATEAARFENVKRGPAIWAKCLAASGISGHADASVVVVENNGTGDSILAGTTTKLGDSTAARLTAGGVWTNATCWLKYKIAKLFPRRGFLEKLKRIRIFSWSPKESLKEKHVGPVFDDLSRVLGLKQVSDYDLAGLAILGVQCLLERVEALEKRK